MPDERASRIAVVDDDERSRRLIVQVLEHAGYYVMPFSGGELLLRMLDSTPYDLLVLDVLMPGLDGFAVAREVRRKPHLARMPILALTGLSDPHDAVRILEAGADAYISKPVDIREVTTLVAQLLQAADAGADTHFA